VIPYLIIVFSAAALLLVTAKGVVLTRELRQQRPVTAPPPRPVPEPKIPADTSRPYPRPKGGRRKQDSTCPVCGTGSSTGALDGRVLGWRAHRSCAEWLGDWKPPQPAPPPYKPDKALIGYMEQGQKPRADVSPLPDPPMQDLPGPATTTHPVVLMTQHGMISLDEARERLNREIVASWGVPPLLLEEHPRKVSDPLPIERCPKCGAQFAGTPDYLRSAYEIHQQTGCRKSLSSLPDGALILTAHLDPSLGSPTGRTHPYRDSSAPWSRSTMIPARSQALRASATRERSREGSVGGVKAGTLPRRPRR